MKVVSIVGARPQFIKAAPLSRELRKVHQEVLAHTGQHYDPSLSAVFFEELDIPRPDYNLGVGSASHGRQTGEMLAGVEEVLIQEEPDWVLVYGDTNSTLAGALAAVKLHIPVAHVEAGLRSFNRRMPEEINRVVTDHISTLLFCPTWTAVRNLAQEGLTQGVHNVGDVMYDAALHNSQLAEERSRILETLGLRPKSYLLATVHRPDNTDIPRNLRSIVAALSSLEATVLLPLHPRTRKALHELGITLGGSVRVVEPVGYLDMLMLEKNARLILTDSGGIQKEAHFFAVPCVTLRQETEWVETVDAGWNVLVGADRRKIIEAVRSFRPQGERVNLFGDGQASVKVVEILSGGERHDPSYG
ncbi:MAG: non-hydrolyzing UDP-N-acetylglucosamine 2-epimerase [Anaerolineae bacterium]